MSCSSLSESASGGNGCSLYHLLHLQIVADNCSLGLHLQPLPETCSHHFHLQVAGKDYRWRFSICQYLQVKAMVVAQTFSRSLFQQTAPPPPPIGCGIMLQPEPLPTDTSSSSLKHLSPPADYDKQLQLTSLHHQPLTATCTTPTNYRFWLSQLLPAPL